MILLLIWIGNILQIRIITAEIGGCFKGLASKNAYLVYKNKIIVTLSGISEGTTRNKLNKQQRLAYCICLRHSTILIIQRPLFEPEFIVQYRASKTKTGVDQLKWIFVNPLEEHPLQTRLQM